MFPAEECGFFIGANSKMPPDIVERARREFMRENPVLAALDTDHDGEISATEIANSSAALKKLDRNGDNKVSRSEFLVITNWLFEFASSPTELALGDLERGPAVTAPAGKRYDPDRVPSGMPGGRGGPWETNKL